MEQLLDSFDYAQDAHKTTVTCIHTWWNYIDKALNEERLKALGDTGNEAVLKEPKQLHDRQVLKCKSASEMSQDERTPPC